MKIFALRTYTPDCENKYLSLECLGHDVHVATYDNRQHDKHYELIDEAKRLQPDAIVYIGAIEAYHGRPCLDADNLCRLHEIAPTIHICGDGSDKPWWPLLEEYYRRGCFAVQVNIDGNADTPVSSFSNGLVLLTPTDTRPFKLADWDTRRLAGLAGNPGGSQRTTVLARLRHVQGFEQRQVHDGYAYAAEFLSQCKIVVNSSQNGSQTGDHVKGRVVEAGMAGACLLESRNQITRRWFMPGVDYLEYDDVDDACRKIEWARDNDVHVKLMAERFHSLVWERHHPSVFWRKVFDKAGVK